jgi:hypothetical protein
MQIRVRQIATLEHPNPSQLAIHVIGIILNIFNMPYHHCCLHIDAMLECCFPFPVCFCFSSVGSGVNVSNDSDVKINNTDDQYLFINDQVKKKNPEYLLYFGYQQQGKQPLPSEPMFQSISKLTILHHPVQLSFIDG